jgi:8-oxo-dGTP pyrophosphatase MutT (NUDIX family)
MQALWAPLDALPPVPLPKRIRAAVLVPLYEDGEDLRVVLTRRPDGMRTHAGDVVFPGGMIDPDDDGPVSAAIREAWEEIGIPPGAVEVIGGLPPVTTRSQEMLIVPVVARIERPAEFRLEPFEVDAVMEPTITELLDDDAWTTQEWHGRTLWFYEFPEGTLWGATAFMVRTLLDFFR